MVQEMAVVKEATTKPAASCGAQAEAEAEKWSCSTINQKQKALLSDGASSHLLKVFDNRDTPSTCMTIYGS